MKKIFYIVVLIILIPAIYSDTDLTYHSAVTGLNSTYVGKVGNLDLGLFFSEIVVLPPITPSEILEKTEWFNTGLFNPSSTGGAIAYILLFLIVAGMIVISEISKMPAFMILSSFAVFFFAWLVILSVSMLMGYLLSIIAGIYMIRSIMMGKG